MSTPTSYYYYWYQIPFHQHQLDLRPHRNLKWKMYHFGTVNIAQVSMSLRYINSDQDGHESFLNNISGEKDEHGCLIGAGYRWCKPYDTCVPPTTTCIDDWGCDVFKGSKWCSAGDRCVKHWNERRCDESDQDDELFLSSGGEKDKHGCLICACYMWCKPYHTCVPPGPIASTMVDVMSLKD